MAPRAVEYSTSLFDKGLLGVGLGCPNYNACASGGKEKGFIFFNTKIQKHLCYFQKQSWNIGKIFGQRQWCNFLTDHHTDPNVALRKMVAIRHMAIMEFMQ